VLSHHHAERASESDATFVALFASRFVAPVLGTALLFTLFVHSAGGQVAARSLSPSRIELTLDSAKTLARGVNAELRASTEAVIAARARERQSHALPNPSFSYGREQTSNIALRNSQDIAQLEQPLEVSGQRGARIRVASARTQAAEARRAAIGKQLDFDVSHAFIRLTTATLQSRLVDSATVIYEEAERVILARLAAGDASGYSARRLRLEAARYASKRAEVALSLRAAKVGLASLLGAPTADISVIRTESAFGALPTVDSLVAIAIRSREEVVAAEQEASALGAETQLVRAERIPVPTLSAGYKGENVRDGRDASPNRLNGFVAGISLPLPLFDRKAALSEASTAEARQALAAIDKIKREIDREVRLAFDALQSVEEQIRALTPHLGPEAALAMRAVQVSYSEGEISLVEWLDAVRTYQESEATMITMQADAAIRRAALERAVGSPLSVR
jgi:cobalt-zinc-cadmium efflux system outer membrane protein